MNKVLWKFRRERSHFVSVIQMVFEIGSKDGIRIYWKETGGRQGYE